MLHIYVTFTVMFIMTAFSPGGLHGFNLFFLYPFPQFILAMFIYNIIKLHPKIYIAFSLTVAVLLPYTVVMRHYIKIYNKIGGVYMGAPAAEDFVRYIVATGIEPILELDRIFMAIDRAYGITYVYDRRDAHRAIRTVFLNVLNKIGLRKEKLNVFENFFGEPLYEIYRIYKK